MIDFSSPNNGNGSRKRRINRHVIDKTMLIEIAWEVCNQLGGIYTVIRSKAPTATTKWGDHYLLVGPYIDRSVDVELEPIMETSSKVGKVVKKMRDMGIEVVYASWLITGRPKVVLINPDSVRYRLNEIKYNLWDNHNISCPDHHPVVDPVILFGEVVKIFLSLLSQNEQEYEDSGHKLDLIAHFHEWMAACAIPEIRRLRLPITTVFTTHATILGRYLAMNSPNFYEHLSYFYWLKEAKHFNIETEARIERAAAHGSHVFTTVSSVTAMECEHLLSRKPDFVLPNGINHKRFEVLHEFQNMHKEYKEQIHKFTMGHFFQSYTFDLENTLYFFTSGRFEYQNKGYDLTLEALARLNWKLKQAKSNKTVVMFFITKRPYHSVVPRVLQSRAYMDELKKTCEAIQQEIGEKLFYEAPKYHDNKLPSLDRFVSDYWKLRFRRTLQAWKSSVWPPVVTHSLVDDSKDEILNFLRTANLVNKPDDKVKVVYHPDFISATNPLFSMDYKEFVRGCHLGVFPSFYEPWGYTPLECMASGIPAVTSDLAGFGCYASEKIKEPDAHGLYITNRNGKSFHEAAEHLANDLFTFTQMNRRDRIKQRNRTENCSLQFNWDLLYNYYEKSYNLAIQRLKGM